MTECIVCWVGWSDEWLQSVEVVSAVRQVLGSHQIPVRSQVAVIETRDGCVRMWRLCVYDPLSCRPLRHIIIALNAPWIPWIGGDTVALGNQFGEPWKFNDLGAVARS